MSVAEGITKHGFRTWYERQLIEGHGYFVTCFLCMIVVAVCMEQVDWTHPWRELPDLAYIAGGLMLGMYSVRRYKFLLVRAETLGEQSTCSHCTTYGVLQVVAAGAERAQSETDGEGDNAWLRVRCKKCGHEWRMDNA